MNEYTLEITLLSDAAFSMGGGVSGLVDSEVQHDDLGLPVISGRAIKGLLVTECAEILHALPTTQKDRWQKTALRLFGKAGETDDQPGGLWVGEATLLPDLAAHIRFDQKPSAADVLDSLTAIRTQTAMSEYGAPLDDTLRSLRVVMRGLTFYAPLHLDDGAGADERALLAACALALRRAGLGRTRGKGKIQACITNRPLEPEAFATSEKTSKPLTGEWLQPLKEALT